VRAARIQARCRGGRRDLTTMTATPAATAGRLRYDRSAPGARWGAPRRSSPSGPLLARMEHVTAGRDRADSGTYSIRVRSTVTYSIPWNTVWST
jgi:hypothetical protein